MGLLDFLSATLGQNLFGHLTNYLGQIFTALGPVLTGLGGLLGNL